MTRRLLLRSWSMRRRVLVGVGGVGFVVPSMVWSLTGSRGLGFGLAAGLFYGTLMASVALWPERVVSTAAEL